MNKVTKILFTGDFCPIGRSESFIINNSIDDAFGDVLSLIQDSDISITDLECPLIIDASPIVKTGPTIKSSIQVAPFLKCSGFSLVTIANNHIMDYGIDGLISTIESCKKAGLEYVGAGFSLNDARRIHYYIVNGLRLAFINICENEWSTTNGDFPGANPVDPIYNFYDIKKAAETSDYVFVVMHGGNEMYNLPSPRFKKLCHFFVDTGADFVICHHTHVFSGYEEYNGGLIFYGLGNFLFDDPGFRNHAWNNGILVQISIHEKEINYNVIPIRQSDKRPGVRLLPLEYQKEFENIIYNLNKIIGDDKILNGSFFNFCFRKNTYNMYYSYLQPYSNKYLKGLFKRGYFPSLISKQYKMLLGNLMKCESHHDVLLNILKR